MERRTETVEIKRVVKTESAERTERTRKTERVERIERDEKSERSEPEYELWIASLKKIGSRKKVALQEIFGSAKEAYRYFKNRDFCSGSPEAGKQRSAVNTKDSYEPNYIEETGIFTKQDIMYLRDTVQKESEEVIKKKYEQMLKKNILFYPYTSSEYPEKLREIPDHPYALFVLGRLPNPEVPSIAVVGARKCTPYGEHYAREYGSVLACCNIQVISGMARGVDSLSQRGALTENGKSFAVLGCGVDVCYPKENYGLYQDLIAQGGVLSELPPGTQPLSMHFPMRNRIISALSDAVFVMEAREKSGSLITADMALEQGKDVYVLPGPIDSALSRGCHELIRQGAGVLPPPSKLPEEIQKGMILPVYWDKERRREGGRQEKLLLENAEDIVYSCLGLFPKNTEELLRETGFAVDKLLTSLVSLQLMGMVKEISKNYYVKV